MLWNYFGITTQSGYTDDDDDYNSYAIDDDAYHYYGDDRHPDAITTPPTDSSPSLPHSPLARSMAIKITSTITRPLVQALKNNIPGVSPLGSPRPSSDDLCGSFSSSPDTQIAFSTTSSPTLAGDVETRATSKKQQQPASSEEDEEKKREDSYWAMYSSVQGTADSTVPSPPAERRDLKQHYHPADMKEDYDEFGKAIPVSTFDSVALDPEAEDPEEDFIRRVEEERSERWSSSSAASSCSSSSRKASRSRSVGGKFKPSSPGLDEVPEPEGVTEFDSDPFGRGFEDAFEKASSDDHHETANSLPLPPPIAEDALGLSLGRPVQNLTTSREDDLACQIRGIYDEWVQTSHSSSPSQESFIAFVRESLRL